MIERISVHDFILVRHLELEFTEGFNVLSGETGAGKSILVGALQVLFGGKAGAELVRSGSEEALVTGVFLIPESIERWLSERGVTPEDDTVLVRRSIRRSGRGSISIQNVPVTRSDLSEFAGFLMDLHSQHEHQSLFVEKNHLRLLDRYADLVEQAEAFSLRFREYSDLKQDLHDLDMHDQERGREIDMLRYAIDEIGAAGLSPDEEETLIATREKLLHFEKLLSNLGYFDQIMNGDEGGLISGLSRALMYLREASEIDSTLRADTERLDGAFYEIEDIQTGIKRYTDGLEYSPEHLEEIEDRLALIRRLQKKYGSDIPEILSYSTEAEGRLVRLENLENDRDELIVKIQEIEKALVEEARSLSRVRSEAARELEGKIETILKDLSMPDAEFQVLVEEKISEKGRPLYSSSGINSVRFLFSANRGEDVRPLQSIASGGEISRVMLAIKSVLAGNDEIGTLVFDEIDVGIGGRVALSMASYMSELAKLKQIICITHLATIAVRADNHTVVEKDSRDDQTEISVRTVAGNDREIEIARMLSGDTSGAESRDHARSLLQKHRGE